MPRQYQIFGPAMVAVNFGAQIPINPNANALAQIFGVQATRFSNLGLTADSIDINLNFRFGDVKTDAYGSDIPIDQQYILSDAVITTRLVHWDADILELCLREATAGGAAPTGTGPAGTLANAGTIMGGGAPAAVPNVPFVPASGYHYVSLNIIPSPIVPSLPWRFPAAYLATRPVMFPLGTERSVAHCTWRAIPYGISTFHNNTILSGGGFTIGTGGSTTTGYLATTSVYSQSDAVALGLTQNTIFLWDHTLDGPFQP